ncbi:hypothetical protein V6Z12_D11G062900 [Gossypium hirsutum]
MKNFSSNVLLKAIFPYRDVVPSVHSPTHPFLEKTLCSPDTFPGIENQRNAPHLPIYRMEISLNNVENQTRRTEKKHPETPKINKTLNSCQRRQTEPC